mmetsp:Transcript_73569/g.207790  ORF Transcript_73569/g.207790 Transcript_73569/m.207790 type:complete len:390 (-) Transcript_73569:39-1208(-)
MGSRNDETHEHCAQDTQAKVEPRTTVADGNVLCRDCRRRGCRGRCVRAGHRVGQAEQHLCNLEGVGVAKALDVGEGAERTDDLALQLRGAQRLLDVDEVLRGLRQHLDVGNQRARPQFHGHVLWLYARALVGDGRLDGRTDGVDRGLVLQQRRAVDAGHRHRQRHEQGVVGVPHRAGVLEAVGVDAVRLGLDDAAGVDGAGGDHLAFVQGLVAAVALVLDALALEAQHDAEVLALLEAAHIGRGTELQPRALARRVHALVLELRAAGGVGVLHVDGEVGAAGVEVVGVARVAPLARAVGLVHHQAVALAVLAAPVLALLERADVAVAVVEVLPAVPAEVVPVGVAGHVLDVARAICDGHRGERVEEEGGKHRGRHDGARRPAGRGVASD